MASAREPHDWSGNIKAISIALTILALLVTFTALDSGPDVSELLAEEQKPVPTLVEGGVNWEATADRILPSVVSIGVTDGESSSSGSGIIWDREGHVLTNAHVVERAGKDGTVQVVLADSTLYEARVLGLDRLADVALVKLINPPNDLVPAKWKDGARVGEPVMAVGSPLGLSGSVTTGIVSAVDRPIIPSSQDSPDAGIINGLQTNAAINQGNSGGALVNGYGEVVGMNSAIATDGSGTGFIGIGFSIPTAVVESVASYLKKGEEFPYGRLGVQVTGGAGEQKSGQALGAMVTEIGAGSPAEAAGLRLGDIVVALNGKRVVGQSQIVGYVNTIPRGEKVKLKVLRRGGVRTIEATLGAPVS